MPTRICPITSGSCSFLQISPEQVVSANMAHNETMNVAIFSPSSSRYDSALCIAVLADIP